MKIPSQLKHQVIQAAEDASILRTCKSNRVHFAKLGDDTRIWDIKGGQHSTNTERKACTKLGGRPGCDNDRKQRSLAHA